MRRLLFLIVLYGILPSCDMINGVIWNKTQKTFVPIFSVPVYAMIQQEYLKQSRALEIHNFQLMNVTLTSFQEPPFFYFYDNNKKVSGLSGELWNLLSDLLNFTLQPVRANVDNIGIPEKDSTYKNGLLGIIFRNETIAIPKIETFTQQLAILDYTIPFGINKHELYIRSEMFYDNTWMIQVFSWKMWCIIFIVQILLSICTFLTQKASVRNRNEYKNTPFSEHLFYNFGNLCNQNYIPKYLDGKSRILEVSLGLFCYVIYMAFGAVLFIYITKMISIPPFDSFHSLITDTKYNVISLKGSSGDIAFKITEAQSFIEARKTERLVVASTIEEMHKLACFSREKKYAIYQGQDEFKVRGNVMCYLTQTGEPFAKVWVASGIMKNFKYKRTLDLGILKLMEVGLLNVLIDRWLEPRIRYNNDDKTPHSIEIYQVSLVIAVIFCGVIIAFIILIIEKIVFIYNLKRLPLLKPPRIYYIGDLFNN